MRKIQVPSERGGICEFDEQPETFCPNCGSKGLWEDLSSYDYYQGTQSWCLTCNTSSYVSCIADIKDGRLEHLKKAVRTIQRITKGEEMTVVYGVWSGYEDFDGVFSTKEKAEAYVAVDKRNRCLIEYTIDELEEKK